MATAKQTGIAMTTTPTFEGRRIGRYIGIVCSEAILGANITAVVFE